jgi:CBS domain containing-hemolysin-like protein
MGTFIIISLIFAVFFTGMRTAFIPLSKLNGGIEKDISTINTGIVQILSGNKSAFIASMATGYYLSLALFAVGFSKYIFSLSASNPGNITTLVILIVCAASLFLILSDFLIRNLSRIFHGALIKLFIFPVAIFYFLFYPIAFVFTKFPKAFQNLYTREQDNFADLRAISRGDLDELLHEKDILTNEANENVKTEIQLFRNALDFSKVKLREIMVPRNEMVVMNIEGTSVAQLNEKFVETGYSRIIFYENTIDNIIGYIHSSVIFKNPESIRPYLTDVLIVPESMPANRLLSSLIREHGSIAIVVDEFGGTSGMVTAEDILEEIFGEIEDEHDTVDILEKKLNDNSYLFSGRAEIDHINSVYNIGLPEMGDFETLAGFILFNYESVPKINSVIEIGKFQLKILKATNTKIELVKLTIKEA